MPKMLTKYEYEHRLIWGPHALHRVVPGVLQGLSLVGPWQTIADRLVLQHFIDHLTRPYACPRTSTCIGSSISVCASSKWSTRIFQVNTTWFMQVDVAPTEGYMLQCNLRWICLGSMQGKAQTFHACFLTACFVSDHEFVNLFELASASQVAVHFAMLFAIQTL